ncbi:MAG: hypothetical protein NZM18_10250 [Thermoflexales bacterium]|nr:hypothetical protein [Thermoflexales bacterium]MDW8352729.1 hypothetical protein [Anaerolineae bacterium]
MPNAPTIATSSRIAGALAYLPIIGWLVVLLVRRHDAFALFHLKQSLGLVVFLIATFVGWVAIAWLSGWIPYAFIVGNALFALVIAAYVFGFFALIAGIVNAARGRVALLPIFGRAANRIRF